LANYGTANWSVELESSKDESKKAAKPSLFGAAEDPASNGAARSGILTELENGTKPGTGNGRTLSGQSRSGRWKLPVAGAVAAALVTGAVALAYIDGDKPGAQAEAHGPITALQTEKPAEKITASKDASQPAAASSADASQEAVAIAKVGEEEGANAAGLAALIVNEPAEAPKESKNKELSKELFGSDTNAGASAKASVAASTQTVASLADKREEKAKTAHASHASAHAQLASKDKKHEPAKVVAQAHGNAKSQAAGAAKQSQRAPVNDSDVALLAAIVAHDKGRFSASDDKADSVRSTAIKARDIVERKPGDSTESLLQRCKRLGSPEGDLCRTRICSGQWSAEPSCTVAD
jgi:hypothetical protein